MEEADPVEMTVAGGSYCLFYFWCRPQVSVVDEDAEANPTCTGELVSLCENCKAFWSLTVSPQNDDDLNEFAIGETFQWKADDFYAYVYIFNGGTTSGKASVTGMNAYLQRISLLVIASLATLFLLV